MSDRSTYFTFLKVSSECIQGLRATFPSLVLLHTSSDQSNRHQIVQTTLQKPPQFHLFNSRRLRQKLMLNFEGFWVSWAN